MKYIMIILHFVLSEEKKNSENGEVEQGLFFKFSTKMKDIPDIYTQTEVQSSTAQKLPKQTKFELVQIRQSFAVCQ